MIHAPSWVAEVLTPPAAIASMITPVNACSVVPTASSDTAAASPRSATSSAPRSDPDLVGGLDPPGGPHRHLTVDELGVGERHRQQLRESR